MWKNKVPQDDKCASPFSINSQCTVYKPWVLSSWSLPWNSPSLPGLFGKSVCRPESSLNQCFFDPWVPKDYWRKFLPPLVRKAYANWTQLAAKSKPKARGEGKLIFKTHSLFSNKILYTEHSDLFKSCHLRLSGLLISVLSDQICEEKRYNIRSKISMSRVISGIRA